MNNSAHLVLQGKGGVGKSLVSSIIAQYLNQKNYTTICGDTDPVNSTFHQIKVLTLHLCQSLRAELLYNDYSIHCLNQSLR
jgi:MinD superfamily P-loop ATPase